MRKENIMSKTISVALANRFNIKLEESLLDSYSLKKYNTLYEESKTNVNKDIKSLSEKYNTITVRDIKMLIIAEMLPNKNKKQLLDKHKKEINL